MSNIAKELGDDIFKLSIEGVLNEIEELLIKEREYSNESKMKIIFKRILRACDYVPGAYVGEARNSVEKLKYAWFNLAGGCCMTEELNLQVPPISEFSDKMTSFVGVDNKFCYDPKEEINVFEKPIRFKLEKDNAFTNRLDFDIHEYRKLSFLDNKSRYEYLKECINYINQEMDKEIYRYERVLHAITLSLTMMPNIRNYFSGGGINTFTVIGLYSNVLFFVTEYIKFKVKSIEEELNSIKLESREQGEYEGYDYLEELKYNFEIFNQQLDFYNVSTVGLNLILVFFRDLAYAIEKIRSFEIKYKCNLIDKDEFLRNINMYAIHNMTQYVIKQPAE